MKVDQFLFRYRENLILIIIGIFYLGYAGFNYMSIQVNTVYFDNIIPGDSSNEIFETIKNSTAEAVQSNMPFLIGIGLAMVLFGLVYKKLKSLALPVFLLFCGTIVYWTIIYNNDLQKMFASLNQIYTDLGLYDHAPPLFSKLLKASQNPGYFRNSVMFLFPMLVAGFLFFWSFRRKKNQAPPIPET